MSSNLIRLLDDALDLALQPGPFLFGQGLGGVDQDGQLAGFLFPAQRRNHLEAIHAGHDQVEEHQIWLVAKRLLDGSLSIFGGQHFDAEWFENGLDQTDGLPVVVHHQHARGHLPSPLAVGHQVELHHQLHQLLAVDGLGEEFDIADVSPGLAGLGRGREHQRDFPRARVAAKLPDQARGPVWRKLRI